MNLRTIETALAYFTLGFLVFYIPVETWASWERLTSPFYIIDLIAMLLLLYGAIRSLRARPRPDPGVLCAAYAWSAANGWRATFGRLSEGGKLEHGAAELWVVGVGTALMLGAMAVLLFLVVRASGPSESSDARRPTV
jgi:hypothetical protein